MNRRSKSENKRKEGKIKEKGRKRIVNLARFTLKMFLVIQM